MHGQGEFTHICGTVYKGNFANNLYVCVVKGIKYLISPFEDPQSRTKLIQKIEKSKEYKR